MLGLKQLALTWVSSVDERDVYPKHETHLRLYVAQWERNSRARKATEQAAKGVAALKKFNAASQAQLPVAHQPRVSPNQLPPPPPEGARAPAAEAQIVGGMRIGPHAMVVAHAATRQRLPTPGNANLVSEVATKVGKTTTLRRLQSRALPG